jgi:hypothetical protein
VLQNFEELRNSAGSTLIKFSHPDFSQTVENVTTNLIRIRSDDDEDVDNDDDNISDWLVELAESAEQQATGNSGSIQVRR